MDQIKDHMRRQFKQIKMDLVFLEVSKVKSEMSHALIEVFVVKPEVVQDLPLFLKHMFEESEHNLW